MNLPGLFPRRGRPGKTGPRFRIGHDEASKPPVLFDDELGHNIPLVHIAVSGQKVQGGGLFPAQSQEDILPACFLEFVQSFFCPVRIASVAWQIPPFDDSLPRG